MNSLLSSPMSPSPMSPSLMSPRLMSLTQAAAKAFGSFSTPGIFGVIVQTILATLVCLSAFVMGTSWLAFHMSLGITNPWLADAIRWGGSVGSMILAWLLFPGIMPVIVGFFDDKIAGIIEEHEYASEQSTRPATVWPEILHDIGFGIKAILLNIVCLPLYLVPVINLFIFYLLNGYLLGSEFFMMVARRHMAYRDADRLRRNYSGKLFIGGMLFAFLAVIPIVNLVAPFWGVALAVHLFHQVYGPGITHEVPGPISYTALQK